MQIEAGPVQIFLGALGQFGAEFLNLAVEGRAINGDPALFQKVDHILIGEWVSKIPTNSTEDDVLREAMVFKWRFAGHRGTAKAQASPSQLINATVPKKGYCVLRQR